MFVYKAFGGMFTYGFIRGLRSECSSDLYSTRILYSFGNGVYYATCVVNPLICLVTRIRIHYKGLDPEKHPSAYKEFAGFNKNIIL